MSALWDVIHQCPLVSHHVSCSCLLLAQHPQSNSEHVFYVELSVLCGIQCVVWFCCVRTAGKLSEQISWVNIFIVELISNVAFYHSFVKAYASIMVHGETKNFWGWVKGFFTWIGYWEWTKEEGFIVDQNVQWGHFEGDKCTHSELNIYCCSSPQCTISPKLMDFSWRKQM